MNIITTRSSAIPIPFTHRAALVLVLSLWFAWLGPLIEGAPYNWTIMFIPFSYVFGFLPALFCGLLYGLVFALVPGLRCNWLVRAMLGCACGAAGAICAMLYQNHWINARLSGIPAGATVGLLYRSRWTGRLLFGTRTNDSRPASGASGAGRRSYPLPASSTEEKIS